MGQDKRQCMRKEKDIMHEREKDIMRKRDTHLLYTRMREEKRELEGGGIDFEQVLINHRPGAGGWVEERGN